MDVFLSLVGIVAMIAGVSHDNTEHIIVGMVAAVGGLLLREIRRINK